MASVTGSVIRVDEQELRGHLDEVVRTSVEETLNGMLDAEADRLCQAKRYERTAERMDTRAGSYERRLQTKAGEVKLKVPRLRSLPFETQIIERYRRRESSVEEALMEMYLAGVSVRRVEDITEALWGTRVSPSTVSELNQQLYERIEAWRNQPIAGQFAYVYLDGIWLKRSWGGKVKHVAVLVAIGVDQDGYRQILGVVEGAKEDTESWRSFLRRYTEDGRLSIDNNVSERTLRHQAIGRKNWLFLGSGPAGPRAAVLFTILAGAKRHRIEPWTYLRELLLRLHDDDPRLEEMLPDQWAIKHPEAVLTYRLEESRRKAATRDSRRRHARTTSRSH